MSKNEIPKQDPKQKKGLTNALKYFFGVGDAGFVLMSNIETFYFMTFLTDLAGFAAGVAGVINPARPHSYRPLSAQEPCQHP